MPFNLDEYEPVEDRLRAFWEEHPQGAVITKLLDHGDGMFIVYAEVYRGPGGGALSAPDATGHAMERETERGVNATSALENCETSAIGRALANLGYAAKGKRPSREEMVKASGGSPSSASSPEKRSTQREAPPEPTSGTGAGEAGTATEGYGEGPDVAVPSTTDLATADDLAAAAKHGLTPTKAKAFAKGLGFEWPPTREQLVAVIERYLEVKK